jgi:hypothetical protein
MRRKEIGRGEDFTLSPHAAEVPEILAFFMKLKRKEIFL